MPDSETFDAFYARTVWNVTSQMHDMAGNDGAADHAIREAFARAYQQWYEVSGYRDSESWVLGVAKDAYERRRPEGAPAPRDYTDAPDHDPLTWPGMFRPAKQATPADPEATLTGKRTGAPGGPGTALPGHDGLGEPLAGSGVPGEPLPGSGVPAEPLPGYAMPPRARARTTANMAGHAGGRTMRRKLGAFGRNGRAGQFQLAGLRSRRTLTAAAVAGAVVVAAGLAYLALGGSSPRSANPGKSAGAVAKPTVHMLPAGQTGTRAAIPWSLVGAGWTLAEVSTAQPDANGAATGGGRYVIYLVDPEGGKYRIQTTSGSAAPELLAWSGDGATALYGVASTTGGGGLSYGLLTLTSGQLTPLPLPADMTALGFTRPKGFNILAVRQGPAKFRLERFNLAGAHQATLGTLPRKSGAPAWPSSGCGTGCNALSSPDGFTAVWGFSGDEMQLVSNEGGLIHKLHPPGGATSCTPLNWWNSDTVLAYCSTGAPGQGQLWLVPANGSNATSLTGVSGSASGSAGFTGAWQAGGAVYITVTSAAQCQTAASGPGGLSILRLSSSGAETPVKVPDSTGNHSSIVASANGRLLVLAQTSCPGTSSLLWLNPTTGTAQTVLTAPPTEVGVIAAVPFGSGPTAVSAGQN